MDESGKINCCYLEIGHINKKTGFTRNIYIQKHEFNSYRQKYNNFGLFTSAYAYNTTNPDDSFLIGNLYFDLDDEKNFYHIRKDALVVVSFLENICGINRNYIRIYFSGKKGIHITVPYKVFGIEPCNNLNEVFKNIATDVKLMSSYKTIDTRIYDKRRLFRTPLSKHQDTNLYKIPLTFDELCNMSQNQIFLAAKTSRVIAYSKPQKSQQANNVYNSYVEKIQNRDNHSRQNSDGNNLSWSPLCIKKLFKQDTQKGNRNNVCAILSSHFRCRGFKIDKIVEIMNIWNDKYCSPKLSDKELMRTINSLYNSDKTYGCNTLRGMELCDEKCKYNE